MNMQLTLLCDNCDDPALDTGKFTATLVEDNDGQHLILTCAKCGTDTVFNHVIKAKGFRYKEDQ